MFNVTERSSSSFHRGAPFPPFTNFTETCTFLGLMLSYIWYNILAVFLQMTPFTTEYYFIVLELSVMYCILL